MKLNTYLTRGFIAAAATLITPQMGQASVAPLRVAVSDREIAAQKKQMGCIFQTMRSSVNLEVVPMVDENDHLGFQATTSTRIRAVDTEGTGTLGVLDHNSGIYGVTDGNRVTFSYGESYQTISGNGGEFNGQSMRTSFTVQSSDGGLLGNSARSDPAFPDEAHMRSLRIVTVLIGRYAECQRDDTVYEAPTLSTLQPATSAAAPSP